MISLCLIYDTITEPIIGTYCRRYIFNILSREGVLIHLVLIGISDEGAVLTFHKVYTTAVLFVKD